MTFDIRDEGSPKLPDHTCDTPESNKDNAQKFKQGKSRAEDASKKKEKVFFIANGEGDSTLKSNRDREDTQLEQGEEDYQRV